MGIKSLGIVLMLSGILAFALINFGIQFASDNGALQSIADDNLLSNFKNNVSNNLGGYNSQVDSASTSFGNSTPTIGAASLETTSVFTIWKNFVKGPKIIYEASIGLALNKIFGGTDQSNQFRIVGIVLTGIIVMVIIIYAWAFIKGASPD